ncbi:MAG TPA: hypothetical protein VFE84_08690 [Patescibacteria group bacterium]|nr:hypothetical protein [Patescibacteria group bacterium]
MRDLYFDLHGHSVSIVTSDADLRSYVRAHFETEAHTDTQADLRVNADWHWGKPARTLLDGLDRDRIERVGRGLVLCRASSGSSEPRRAIWTRIPGFPELTMAFELQGDIDCRLNIEARCVYEPKGVGKRLEYLRPGRMDRKRNRLFFKLMYFMIYYPMAWQLERTRGWGLLHASAVAMPSGKAVILSGLGGVGKSTLGLSLLARPGARLLSDNLIFHDEDRIYSCPEPVRLDATALAGMVDSGIEPQRTRLPVNAHPKPTYRVGPARRAGTASPAAVYFLRFASRSEISPIAAERAAEMLIAGNDLAAEIKDYRPCHALLSMLAAEAAVAPRVTRADLVKLLRQSDCAVFRIGEGEKISTTAARLAERMEAAG